ncbi:hypothetical protein [Mangrovibacter plantisponsor]|uniref:Uncharacterized protein n=1 Tax=Mangrovibacter plantisponsor TaxID=451513 RepID=A0A317PGY3_9ENTR|nr:hypothetical protein [Mangrovibacter plantisponsor]PWV98708.1 hypothetical protein DES37_1364 [Mangrovibacter plantisponsor]
MINNRTFDESLYPMSWRFNSDDCHLSDEDKKHIVFLSEHESERLWDLVLPFNILMRMNKTDVTIIDKMELDFDDVDESKVFFQSRLSGVSNLFFFWGRRAAALVSTSVVIKSWGDFFYPSDESSIIFVPNTKKIIFSYEEMFFYGELTV